MEITNGNIDLNDYAINIKSRNHSVAMSSKTRSSGKLRILLIGPKPPPSNGTTVKFDIFHQFVANQLGSDLVDVIDTNICDNTVVALFTATRLRGYARIIIQTLCRGVRADVITVFGSQRFAVIYGSLVVSIFRLFGKSIYISLFGGFMDKYLETFARAQYQFVKLLFANCDGIIAETRCLQRSLSVIWPGKVFYAPNFRHAHLVPNNHFRNEHLLRFMYVGDIRREKGIGELVNAFTRFEQNLRTGNTHTQVELHLYGPICGNSSDMIDLLPIEQSSVIFLHGEVTNENVRLAFIESDIFVFPSYYPGEGHSGAVIEALMHGLPVIATDWRSTPELVHHNENGLLVPPCNADALLAAMEILTNDIELRSRLAEGAIISAREFDAQNVCETLLEIILGKHRNFNPIVP